MRPLFNPLQKARQVGFQQAIVEWEGTVLEERIACTKQTQKHKEHISKAKLPKVQKLLLKGRYQCDPRVQDSQGMWPERWVRVRLLETSSNVWVFCVAVRTLQKELLSQRCFVIRSAFKKRNVQFPMQSVHSLHFNLDAAFSNCFVNLHKLDTLPYILLPNSIFFSNSLEEQVGLVCQWKSSEIYSHFTDSLLWKTSESLEDSVIMLLSSDM